MTEPRSWAAAATGSELLRTVAPTAAGLLVQLSTASTLSPEWTDGIASTVGRVHGLPLGEGTGSSVGTGSPLPPAVRDFATAFATDVSSIDDELRGRFLERAGGDAFAVVQTVYPSPPRSSD
mgnify:CR=1 FL=1